MNNQAMLDDKHQNPLHNQQDLAEPFNCCLIGDDTLLISCAEILLSKRHEIIGIISKNTAIKAWANERHIVCFDSMVEAKGTLKRLTFDYLFSVANSKILQSDEISLPKKLAINYHYALLPKYAGTYATSWAILNEEKVHGITWHAITTQIDGGDILKQKQFTIDKNETALSLNLKCFEYAVQTFEELVSELESNHYTLKKQDMTLRTYSPLKKRPPQNGVIYWQKSAQDIYKLHRALTFGNYFNQLGVLKLLIEKEVFYVKELRLLRIRSIAAPGTVIRITDNALQVSTTTFDIALSTLCTLEGVSLSLSDLIKRFKIGVGYQLPIPKPSFFEQLELVAASYVQYEDYWLNELAKIIPGKEAFFAHSKNRDCNMKQVSTTRIPNSIFTDLQLQTITDLQPRDALDALLAAVLIYLYKLNGCDNFSAWLTYPELLQEAKPFNDYYTRNVPLTSSFSPKMCFEEGVASVIQQLRTLKGHKTYTRDINLRYPQLSSLLNLNLINIEVVESSISYIPKEFPLSIVIVKDASELNIFADTNLLDLKHVATLLSYFSSHVIQLLTQVANNLDAPISKLPFLTQDERQKILVDWNNTETTIPQDKMVHQLFEKQVVKTPHDTALVFKDQQLTFMALNEQANQLAHHLKQYKLSSNEVVAIGTERSLEMVVAILAVLKAGCAYLPLDPKYPTERLLYLLKDSQAKIVLFNSSTLKDKMKDYTIDKIDLVQEQSIIRTQPKTDLMWQGTPQDLAYVIYTSGTTGNPKGVAVPHLALLNHMLWMIPKFNFTEKNIFLQKTPFSFDASVWEFFAPLLSGGKLIMSEAGEPAEMLALIKRHQVNVLQVVPSLLRQFLEDDELQYCSSLEKVFSGGEALLPDTIQLFFKKMGDKKLFNLYGPTEATIQVITHGYQASDSLENAIVIGKPIHNVHAYVLDQCLNPVPAGLTGELYIGGICLAKGYLNRDELTQTCFIDNPFNQQFSKRLYKTGDRVRWSSEGILEYLGRLDDQVKFNGFRIELSEIEAALLQHESIRDCAVLIQEQFDPKYDKSNNKCLVAYYVKKQDITQADTKSFVEAWEDLYESQYAALDSENHQTHKINIQGWKSSYTDQTIEQKEMLEWVNDTIARLRGLKPKTILEIGSGSGLVLFNILDDCEYYYATDFSKNVIDYTKKVVNKLHYSDKVKAIACAAHEIAYSELKKPYDTVVINSVAQYFPSLEYLESVILNVISHMASPGQIFIGDIRDFRLLKCFHYSVLSYKHSTVSKSEVEYFALRDKELLLSPDYFLDLKTRMKDITAVEILPKLGKASHEMNRYRYDVVLHIKKSISQLNGYSIEESKFDRVVDLKNYLDSHLTTELLCIKYPNQRIASDYFNYCQLFDVTLKGNSLNNQNLLSISEISELASRQGFNVKFFLDPSDPLYLYLVLLSKNSDINNKQMFIEYAPRSSLRENFANYPLATQKMLESEYAQKLKSFLSEKLPSYMVPTRYIPLEKMPLNRHGKIDKSALFEPQFIKSKDYLAPRTETEIQMCRIYAQVLGLSEEQISIEDDFFALGGHSLSALRALTLAKKIFGIQLPTSTLFEYPTAQKLAAFIEKAKEDTMFISQQNLMASPLIALQKNGFKAPLFMVHPLGGTIFWYKALSRYLGNNRPIYAIQDPGIQANKLLFNTLEEMANFYLKAIQEIQPKGPYLLAGASFGGTVVIEIANQLLKAGEKVNFIGLLDAWPVYSEKFWEKSFLEKLMLSQFQRVDAEFNSQGIYNLEFLLKLHQHRASMLRHYKIPTIQGQLTFFKAKEPWPVFKEMVVPVSSWQPYTTRPVDIQLVSGNHETMFWEPQVQLLAKQINLSLDKIESQMSLAKII